MMAISVSVLPAIADLAAQADWDACACTRGGRGAPAQPIRHPSLSCRRLSGPDRSGLARAGRRCIWWRATQAVWWASCRFMPSRTVRANISSTIPGRMPMKGQGGAYYPKLQSAVPFTPVTGPRFLHRHGRRRGARSAAGSGAIAGARQNQHFIAACDILHAGRMGLGRGAGSVCSG